MLRLIWKIYTWLCIVAATLTVGLALIESLLKMWFGRKWADEYPEAL